MTVKERYPLLLPAVTTLIFAYFSYVLAKLIYRLFFHPLSQFPGPKLPAATFWYEAYFDILKSPGGQYTYELDRLHAIYGPVIRSNPEQIHIKNSEWFDVLYAGPGHVRNKWERSNRANGSPGSVASTVQHDLHRLRRGALNPFFSKKAVTALQEITRNKVDEMCMRMKDYSGQDKILDLGTAFTAVTLDVITKYCYDSCLNCVSQPDFAPQWKKLMGGLFEPVPVTKHFPWVLKILQSLPRSWNPDFEPFLECRDTITKQAQEVWRTEKGISGGPREYADEKPKTVFHGIMQSNIPDSEKTIERLSDEAFVLIVAGGETTARVLTVIMAHLLQNRQLFMRLREELDDTMVQNLLSTRTLENIPLMKAVIQEGVRIAAPVTNGAILIAPNEDLKCDGWVIPRGVSPEPCLNVSHD
jgi:cytochrome P450